MRIAIKDDIGLAFATLSRAKWRSGLTMLGVIIGVLSVILVVGIGEGAKRQVATQINNIGKDSLLITPDASADTPATFGNSNYGSLLKPSDVTQLQKDKQISQVAPLARVHSLIKNNDKTYASPIWASSSAFSELYNRKIRVGSFFEDNGDINGVVLGSDSAYKMFGEAAPLGQTLSILGQDFVVYGVLDEVSAVPWVQGVDFNNSVIVSYDFMSDLTKSSLQPIQIIVKTRGNDPAGAAKMVSQQLQDSRGGLKDFSVLTHSQAAANSDEMLSVVTLAIIGIAIVSLLVGGIGIMNVMFASVTERMHEIGLRKAIGATNRQIMRQFLTESLVVSLLGGIIGAVLAIVSCVLLDVYTDLDPVVNYKIVGLALAITVLVGAFFGTIPALKAARKDPIDALRHE